MREDAPGLLAVERGGPRRPWTRRLHTLLWINVVVGFVFVPSAVANPFCYIPMLCEAKAAIDFVKDPLGFLLQKLTDANIWFLQKMLELIQNSTKIDLTSPGFLKQYAIIFAASSLITVALWLIAVAKRAIRGVSITTAVGEAVGFLVLQFMVNALTPAAIALLMKAIDEVTAIFEPYATQNFKPFLENLLKILAANPSDGVGQLLVVNAIMLFGALLMWIELLIRSAAIYVAVALGPLVNAGLVDRDLWGKSKKWFGAIIALGLSKPVLFALLGLGGAILSDSTGSMSDAVSKTLVGALILLLAVFASGTLYRWVPAFGDEMAQLHHDRKSAQSSGPAAAVDGPAQHTNRALNTHIQDSLVGGGKAGASGGAQAAGNKAAASSTVAKQAGGASTAGTASAGGATAAAGPAGVALAAAKASVDMAKSKATSSPGMQGADAGQGSTEKSQGGRGSGPSDAPAAAQARGASSDPVVGSGSSPSPGAGESSSGGPPAAARSQAPGTGPVVSPPAPPGPEASSAPPARPTGPSPSPSAGTASGTGPPTPPPASKPSTGQGPAPTSKDK
ncbi:hypothetical protein ACFRJ1_07035 [Streptomyces sp. NPDC056773]|uniref:hypothetical protein n=1 Tax=unclassified Streptomyces TaxID=2593676 RepID=UPI00369BB4CD